MDAPIIPQANSLPKLFGALAHVRRNPDATLDTLATHLGVEARTARYYLDLLRALEFVTADTPPALTLIGRTFAQDPDARPGLYAQAILRLPLAIEIDDVRRSWRADHDGAQLPLRDAAMTALASLNLSETTRARRATSITTLLEAAAHPETIDWLTGDDVDERETVFSFESRSFLTSMQARVFSEAERHAIGWPRQVLTVVRHGPESVEAAPWAAAHDRDPDTGRFWFGSLPITPETRAIVARRGRGLRALLVRTVPHVTLLMGLLSDETPTTIARDMFGLRLWHDSEDLGPLEDILGQYARALALTIVPGRPWHSGLDGEAASLSDLVVLCEETGLLVSRGASLVLDPEFAQELKDARRAQDSLGHQLQTLRAELPMLWRRWRRRAQKKR